MFKGFRNRLSPTTVIACIALFFAIAGGSAIALQGRNSVDSGDIKRGNVKTSDIANNAVTTRKIKNNHVRRPDIQNNAVGSGEIVNGQVGQADLAPDEAFRKVGSPGNPAFGNGGEGDCIWSEVVQPPLGDPFNEPAFYKDHHGVVRLTGGVTQADGPGGDAACDDLQDGFIFTLPPGYRPAEIVVFTGDTTDLILVVGDQDVVTPTGTLPAGTVVGSGPTPVLTVLDAVSFRAAGPGTGLPRRDGAVHLTAETAEALGIDW